MADDSVVAVTTAILFGLHAAPFLPACLAGLFMALIDKPLDPARTDHVFGGQSPKTASPEAGVLRRGCLRPKLSPVRQRAGTR
jgi:hypothetical protein